MDAARRGPLHGLPVAVKDNIDTADMPTGYGSPIYDGHRPGVDAACVAQLKAAGAFMLGKTVAAELANFTPRPHPYCRLPLLRIGGINWHANRHPNPQRTYQRQSTPEHCSSRWRETPENTT